MATLGLTKLEMVNQVAEAIGTPPVSVLPSTASDTTSIYARAEDTLDRVGRRVLGRGWPCNTVHSKLHTAAGASNEITLAADVLRINCTAPGRYAGRLSIRGDKVVIQDEGATDFGSAVGVYLDLIVDLALEDASPDVKEIIATEAAQEFQRRYKGSQAQDQYLTEERTVADIQADRNAPKPQKTWNNQPLITAQPRQREGE